MKRPARPPAVSAPSDRIRVRLDVVVVMPQASVALQMPDGSDVRGPNATEAMRRCCQAWLDLFALGVLNSGCGIRIEDGTAAIRLGMDKRKARRR